MALFLAGLLGAVILVVEIVRPQPVAAVDGLRVTSVLFFLAHALSPIHIATIDHVWLVNSSWGWILAQPGTPSAQVVAGGLALLSYITVAAAYLIRWPRRPGAPVRQDVKWSRGLLWATGIFLCVAGTAALIGYTGALGGVAQLFIEGMTLRTGETQVESRWAFLKSITPLSLGASYIMFVLWREAEARREQWAAAFFFLISLIVALVSLFHAGGRLFFLAFLATFPLAAALRRGRIGVVRATLGGLFVVVMALFGKQLFNIGYSDEFLADQWSEVARDARRSVDWVLVEFNFPHTTLVSAVDVVPDEMGYRYFSDIQLGVLYLIPQRLIGRAHPKSLSAINTDRMMSPGQIPIGLVAFGWFSLGTSGVLIVSLLFGLVLRWCDGYFRADGDRFDQVFRVAVGIFLGFRVLYADPVLVAQAGFFLIVTFGVLFGGRWLLRGHHVGDPLAPARPGSAGQM